MIARPVIYHAVAPDGTIEEVSRREFMMARARGRDLGGLTRQEYDASRDVILCTYIPPEEVMK